MIEQPSRRRIRKGSKTLPIPDKPPKSLTPREAAVRDYVLWLKSSKRIDHITNQTLDQQKWEDRDKALFNELINGVVRHHGRIEWIIKELSKKGLNRDHFANASAAIGIYQLLYLDRVPAYAAVDAAVDITSRRVGDAASKWVNAILRQISNDIDHWKTAVPITDNTRTKLAQLHSYPTWMAERWGKQFYKTDQILHRKKMQLARSEVDKPIPPVRDAQLEQFLIWSNRRPNITIRVNTHRTTQDELIGKFKRHNIGFHVTKLDPLFINLEHSFTPSDLNMAKNGLVSVQDVSQGLVAKLVAPQPKELILDLCAAPGGKTGHLAELCPECQVIATDKDERRLEMVSQNVTRCSYDNVKVIPYDDLWGTDYRVFDAILVDAPCTGTGVLARRADARWRRIPQDFSRMVAIQSQLLKYAADRVRQGGRIIYSTCSIEEEENEQIIEQFLIEHNGFKLVNAGKWLPEHLVDELGQLSVKGHEVRADGVFAARLERKM